MNSGTESSSRRHESPNRRRSSDSARRARISAWRGTRVVAERRAAADLSLARLAHALGRPAERDHGAQERAHAGAADPIDRQALLGEHLQDPDVSERPGASTGENERERAPGEPPGDPARRIADIVSSREYVVRARRRVRPPARDESRAWARQRKTTSLPAGTSPAREPCRRPRRQRGRPAAGRSRATPIRSRLGGARGRGRVRARRDASPSPPEGERSGPARPPRPRSSSRGSGRPRRARARCGRRRRPPTAVTAITEGAASTSRRPPLSCSWWARAVASPRPSSAFRSRSSWNGPRRPRAARCPEPPARRPIAVDRSGRRARRWPPPGRAPGALARPPRRPHPRQRPEVSRTARGTAGRRGRPARTASPGHAREPIPRS